MGHLKNNKNAFKAPVLTCALASALALTGLSFPGHVALAGDLAAGKDKARKCRVCHGADGIARIPNAPNIGGESKFYLTKQLKAFRAGERKDLQMSTIAGRLSDEDIDDVVEYYSAIQITHIVPDIP